MQQQMNFKFLRVHVLEYGKKENTIILATHLSINRILRYLTVNLYEKHVTLIAYLTLNEIS